MNLDRSRDDVNDKSERKYFRCGDPNHLIRECPKPPKDKNQRAFIGGSWSDNGEEDDEKAKDEMCLVAQASNEVKIDDPNITMKEYIRLEKEKARRRGPREGNIDEYWWRIYKSGNLEVLES
ncbi:zf-CCHC domain-containing protein [Tanacetum coccineum]